MIGPAEMSPESRTIHITAPALTRIRAGLAREKCSGSWLGLRLELSGGACAGLNYELRFENGPQPRDRSFILKMSVSLLRRSPSSMWRDRSGKSYERLALRILTSRIAAGAARLRGEP